MWQTPGMNDTAVAFAADQCIFAAHRLDHIRFPHRSPDDPPAVPGRDVVDHPARGQVRDHHTALSCCRSMYSVARASVYSSPM